MRLQKPRFSAILGYGISLAAAAFLLQWLDYQHLARQFATEAYLVALAVGFTVLGVWAGLKLTPVARPANFARNDRAIRALQITDRELDVLVKLAEGHANDEIARLLHVSPNTIKTHLGRIYGKLQVSRRTQAVNKARTLGIVK